MDRRSFNPVRCGGDEYHQCLGVVDDEMREEAFEISWPHGWAQSWTFEDGGLRDDLVTVRFLVAQRKRTG